MKITNFLRTLLATCAFAASAQASAVPVLIVDNEGILTGAKNVDVAGTLYNVTFADGSCNTLFSGCSQSVFSFSDEVTGLAAAQALLSQVLIDGPAGQFDSLQNKTFGCGYATECATFIPYFRFPTGGGNPRAALAVNYAEGAGNDFVINTDPDPRDDFSRFTFYNYAVFQIAPAATTDVPEPTSIALFALAMAGLAFNHRRKV